MEAAKEPGIWARIQTKLEEHGVYLDVVGDVLSEVGNLCNVVVEEREGSGGSKVKVVCIAPDLKDTIREMGQKPWGQVVMVRIDDDTSRTLDAWIETGAVKSRSEAAAVFIGEGLKVRASELARLEEALRDVEKARERLRNKAREVFGQE